MCVLQVALRELHLAKVFAQHCVLLAEPLLTDRVARLAVDAVAHISCNVTTSQMQRDVGHVLGELHAGSKESVVSLCLVRLLTSSSSSSTLTRDSSLPNASGWRALHLGCT